jgi:4a-hydroxytetrahydrobiopterin dehydratase
MERRLLSDQEKPEALERLKSWNIVNGKLHKEFRFRDFKQAFGFMTQVALIAEAMDHHPDWSNVYNRVTIDLITHDLKGISSFDVEFAARVEKLLS